jgi:serine/threonine-protein kinase
MITMKIIKLAAIPVIGLTVGLGLAACGSSTPTPAATVTASSAPTAAAATTPAPAAPAQPAPVKTVYVQAPAAEPAPALTDCGGGVYAGADTSCPFAQNVAANYTGPGADYAYSPVTGLSYIMNCNTWGYGNVTCTGGDNASVQFDVGV